MKIVAEIKISIGQFHMLDTAEEKLSKSEENMY